MKPAEGGRGGGETAEKYSPEVCRIVEAAFKNDFFDGVVAFDQQFGGVFRSGAVEHGGKCFAVMQVKNLTPIFGIAMQYSGGGIE